MWIWLEVCREFISPRCTFVSSSFTNQLWVSGRLCLIGYGYIGNPFRSQSDIFPNVWTATTSHILNMIFCLKIHTMSIRVDLNPNAILMLQYVASFVWSKSYFCLCAHDLPLSTTPKMLCNSDRKWALHLCATSEATSVGMCKSDMSVDSQKNKTG